MLGICQENGKYIVYEPSFSFPRVLFRHFLVWAVLALVAGGSNEPYAATMMDIQGNRHVNNNLRFIDRELDVNYGGQGQGKSDRSSCG
jgi:hypothetical protein